MTFGQMIVRYWFQPIQLNRLDWRDYMGSNNPIATALMAKMNVLPEERLTIRKECLRMFVTLKLDRRKARVINEFMATYLTLTAEEARQLRKEIETTMPQAQVQEYTRVVDGFELLAREEGLAEGIDQGIEQGLREGEMRFAMRLLESKFGTLDPILSQQIAALQLPKLEALGIALLNFQAAEELEGWLNSNA